MNAPKASFGRSADTPRLASRASEAARSKGPLEPATEASIELDSSWSTHERVLGLPLRGVPAPGEPRFVGEYLAEQPMARVGVAVDVEQRAEGADNVLVAGAALPGAAAWREGSQRSPSVPVSRP